MNDDLSVATIKKIATYVGAGVVGLSLLFGSVFTVDQGSRGVVLRNGAVTRIASPGLGFKVPFFESVKDVSVRNQSEVYKNQQAYSYDQQPASMQVSVSYHVSDTDVLALYSKYGSLEGMVQREISRQVPTQTENTFGRYTAVSVVQDRSKFVTDLTSAIRNAVKNSPVVIDSVQVENIDFSQAYERSIEQRMQAEIEVTKRQQDLKTAEVSAKIQVTNAQAEADSKLAQATAEAKATALKGEAEAQAIKAKGEALAANQSLIELTKAERWNGILPTTMVPNSTVPFLNVGDKK